MKPSLAHARLYLVLDASVANGKRLFEILKLAADNGVDMVQLRDKNGGSRQIVEFASKAIKILRHRIPFILNDRADCALASGADGVHLGQEDLPLPAARKILGQKAIIGISCQTLEQAKAAERQGADYIGFGSVLPTLTKPGRKAMDLRLLTKVHHKITIPVFAIGGITLTNLDSVLDRGVTRVAVTRAICLAENVGETVREFKARVIQW